MAKKGGARCASSLKGADKNSVDMMHCKECGQKFPLDLWLAKNSHRTLWTTSEIMDRYGGSALHIGHVMSRLGFKSKPIRQRLRGGSLSKKRALYCVTPESFKRFRASTARQLRYWLACELNTEAEQILAAKRAAALASAMQSVTNSLER